MKLIKYDPTNKYTWCYCDKKQVILLGWGVNVYANVFVSGALIFFCAAALAVKPLSWIVPIAIGLTIGWALMVRSSYRDFFKEMREAGHSIICSKKIALKATMCEGEWNNFKINVDPKEVDPQGDYGTPALMLWFVSSLVNWAYIILLGGDDVNSKSLFFPIFFLVVMICSLVLLIRIRNMRLIVLLLLLWNIIISSLFLLFYLLDLFV